MGPINLQNAVNVALSSPRTDDLIAGVKHAVVTELEALDPAAEIRMTDYFNHSFAPDLVLRWSDSGRRAERGVYLRYSMQAAAAGHDVTALSDLSPVLIALRTGEDPSAEAQVKLELPEAPSVLLTNTGALDDLSPRQTGSGGRQLAAEAEPLFELVRSNLMRGGRGLLVGGTAQKLASQSRPVLSRDGQFDQLDRFTASVQELFLDAAATRLNRAANLLRLGLSGDRTLEPDLVLGQFEQGVEGGRLSEAELGVLVPYLLSRQDVTTSPRYWAYLGSMLTLADLERMWDRLLGLDLTRLVEPNLHQWLATRAAVTHRLDGRPADAAAQVGWRLEGHMLTFAADRWTVQVTADKRKLRLGENARPAAWAEISQYLREFRLAAVTLQGSMRKIRVDAEGSANVYDDVLAITENLDDEFRVPSVDIDVLGPEPTRINADFTTMLATAAKSVSIGELVRVALGVLSRHLSSQL